MVDKKLMALHDYLSKHTFKNLGSNVFKCKCGKVVWGEYKGYYIELDCSWDAGVDRWSVKHRTPKIQKAVSDYFIATKRWAKNKAIPVKQQELYRRQQ